MKPRLFVPFSRKQKKLLTWWTAKSPHHDKDGVIAEGSVRSGKTVAMILSFMFWSQKTFKDQNFIIAGKTMGALKRNVIGPIVNMLRALGIAVKYHRSSDMPHLVIGSNTYYLFAGNNEASQDVLQGLTAAGSFLDEVALMPENFIEQVLARCSIDGAKHFWNCNPESPFHPIKVEFIDKADEKRFLVLHFELDDNPSLSPATKDRLRRMFSGVFYKRFILGLWVLAEGVIYSMFDQDAHTVDDSDIKDLKWHRFWIACDYGTSNATTFLWFGLATDGRLYELDEYYHSGGETGAAKSPSGYSKEFRKWFAGNVQRFGRRPEKIFIDPSAEGFMLQLWTDDPALRPLIQAANNEVLLGISLVSSLIDNDLFRVHRRRCPNTLKEFAAYSWDPNAQAAGEDRPIKQFDHTMDCLRYVTNSTRTIWTAKIAAKGKAA